MEGKKKPKHVAIIMDGNGRWAKARKLQRSWGHKHGVKTLRETVKASLEIGIETLYVYAFSSENWGRNGEEVSYLIGLAKTVFSKDVRQMHKNGVRVRIIGGRDDLEPQLVRIIEDAEDLTKNNTKLTLAIAFNYGGRQELVRAVRRIAFRVTLGEVNSDEIDLQTIEQHLDTFGLPYPDLVIRTGGEKRISNFLLWQCAYSEFVFFDVLWPDFNKKWLEEAIRLFGERDRRFGCIETT